jgi:uncharacterized membrane protein YkvA (DUF1232 family)
MMNTQQLREIITDAQITVSDPLERYLQRAAPVGSAELADPAAFARQIIDGVPALLADVARAAEERGVGLLVQPLLEHAAAYFVEPLDHAPELAFGVVGLLDDAYLALRIVHLIQETYQPLVRVDVAGQLAFLRQVLGPDLVTTLDAETGHAIFNMAMTVAALRQRAGE